MQNSLESMDLIKTLAMSGNPNSVSDAGVAAACARSAVLGGYLNVMINIKDYDNETEKNKIINKAEKIKEKAIKKESQILKKTIQIIQKPI